MDLDEVTIAALALGCALYGGGGGGEPGAGALMAQAALDEGLRLSLLTLDDLPDEGVVLPVAMIGSPTVGVEKLPRGDEGARLKARFETLLGQEVVAFMPGELGGINGVVPFAWAARAGVPVVDADLIGRAFPGVQYTVPALLGRDTGPVVMVDERGNVATFDVVDASWAHRFTGATMVAAGALMGMALWPMTVAQARTGSVVGSVSRALRAGQVLRGRHEDAVAALMADVGGERAFEGKVVDVDRRTEGGLALGSAVVEGTGSDSGRLLRLEFQNENLVAMVDGAVVASVPDVLTILDLHSAWPIVTESLRYGQRVALVVIPCDEVWRTEAGIAAAGPRAFGYDLDHQSLGGVRAR